MSLALAALMVFSWPRPVGWLLALTGSARPPHEPALPAEPSIVVLPFRDLSQDGGRTYLAEGISEDLASALGRFPTLFVIARGSAASYQAADIPIEAIGRELGVRYVVQGSVRAAGDQLVVTSQLVDAGTGVQLWANRVETPIGDALRVQAQLAEEIVGVLGTRIESAEIERLRRLPTDDLDAYELYVRARAEFGGDARLAGLFFGTAIHDTAQVAGAGLLYAQQYAAPEALDTATVTKLVRNLFMLAVIPLIALLQRRSGGRSAATQRLPLRQLVPFFVAGFAALALVRTLGDLGATPFGGWLDASAWGAAIDLVSACSTWCLGVAMAGIGLSTRLGRLRRLGLQPLAAGFAAALTVGLVSAALVLGLAQRMS